MSVLIKGMELPKNCSECPVALSGKYCRINKTYTTYIKLPIRPDHCPLVEIKTPHGDLIDRNALKKEYRMGNDCNNCETDWKSCQYDRVYSKMDFCEWIDDAPVVVEAEGEG